MESNSITPTPSPATNFTHSSTGTTPSQTPTSTPIPVSSSQVPTIQNGASVPPIDSASIPPIDSASIPPLESVKRKNKSIAWEHFTKMTNPDGSKMAKARAKCSHCTQTYAVDSKSNGTTNMRTHLLYQCRKSPLFIPSKKQRYLAFDSAENGGNVIAIEFDKDTSRFACVKMIIKDELPFSYVEGQGFVDFMRVTQPKFKPPSRRTIARDIWDLYQVVKDGMDELDSSIDAIRNCVKYIRGSPARLDKFRKCAAQEKIEYKGWVVPLDVAQDGIPLI
ncbi:hypothetical protein M0R45_006709 [Rubus argutus]|uniref:BED-type domain-containing protein n=1 Tax=Rubus argutus TaxID=59490 RepID=A0AAW1YRF4_RUBAR